MLLTKYVELRKFRRLVPDCITAVALSAYFLLIAEKAKPFLRQFKLSDPRIQHPFAVIERVTGPMCILISVLLPLAVMTVVVFCKYRHKNREWHMLNVSLLGLTLCISIDCVLTDVFKAWIGKHRPDFLARCGPLPDTLPDVYTDISVCTAPLGASLLEDGMRSCPSGHSLISFAAFGYLFMWLFGQWGLGALSLAKPIYMYLIVTAPLMCSSYIALSRVQDYRHSFTDVALGSALGCVVAFLVYRLYFRSFWEESSEELVEPEQMAILPI
ncbi:Dpp2 protein [Metschnikowia bicuspidata]|uniref:Dpp2 protein n=1 Tax=Metschnikowia bicuspidata TaxID=27322 RepID=A0A4P9Z9K2_9ASCO|nr:Dpp2 protein [Metschnikowia bicuspidata]